MSLSYSPNQINFGLLPEPEHSPVSFIASMGINGLIVLTMVIVGAMARRVIVEHRYEDTVLIVPTMPPPTPAIKIPRLPNPPKITPPRPREVKLDLPKIDLPKPRPEPKPLQMEAKENLPLIRRPEPVVVLAPQPKAAMPAQSAEARPATASVHLGDTFGVTPNPNANRPATVAAIGNPYGGLQGAAQAPHGVVGSAGLGNGLRSGSSYAGSGSSGGRVGAAGLPTIVASSAPAQSTAAAPASTSLEVISKPPVQYTDEARRLKIQGDVVLRVTFTAAGQVVVQGVLRGLGHGLDEEARRVAQQIRFHPATRNGQPMDSMTNITITFQLT